MRNHVEAKDQTGSGKAIIQVESETGENCIIIHSGTNGSITECEIDRAFERFDKGDILLLQNELPVLNTDYAIKRAAEKGRVVFCLSFD